MQSGMGAEVATSCIAQGEGEVCDDDWFPMFQLCGHEPCKYLPPLLHASWRQVDSFSGIR